ncbi:hypothetical protein, partial [Escherichia coli]|uniref:hypothetical protein n=1 Tax=Escherichia coli TaxID=562 RepID=UPI0031B5D4C3
MSPLDCSGFHARLPILRQRKNYIRKCRKKASQKKGLFAEQASLRIPLYSITDWHRSPISDSHP